MFLSFLRIFDFSFLLSFSCMNSATFVIAFLCFSLLNSFFFSKMVDLMVVVMRRKRSSSFAIPRNLSMSCVNFSYVFQALEAFLVILDEAVLDHPDEESEQQPQVFFFE